MAYKIERWPVPAWAYRRWYRRNNISGGTRKGYTWLLSVPPFLVHDNFSQQFFPLSYHFSPPIGSPVIAHPTTCTNPLSNFLHLQKLSPLLPPHLSAFLFLPTLSDE